ncbi:hypothetical protein Hanom_Chr06g00539981 [Helianthus anomalus]
MFPSSTNSSVVVIYSAMYTFVTLSPYANLKYHDRIYEGSDVSLAMCFIDFRMPVDKDDRKVNGHDFSTLKK